MFLVEKELKVKTDVAADLRGRCMVFRQNMEIKTRRVGADDLFNRRQLMYHDTTAALQHLVLIFGKIWKKRLLPLFHCDACVFHPKCIFCCIIHLFRRVFEILSFTKRGCCAGWQEGVT